MRAHLSRDYCLEVLAMRGKSDQLAAVAERILATRGVKHGGIEIVTGVLADREHASGERAVSKPQKRLRKKRK